MLKYYVGVCFPLSYVLEPSLLAIWRVNHLGVKR